MRGKQTYNTIGPLLLLPDPDLVREAAERAKAMLREGGDPAPLFESPAPDTHRRRRRSPHGATCR